MLADGMYYIMNEEGREYFHLESNILFLCLEYIDDHNSNYYSFNEVSLDNSFGIAIQFRRTDPDFKKLKSYFIKLSKDDLIIRDIIL